MSIELSATSVFAPNVDHHNSSCLITTTAYPDWRRLKGGAGRNLAILYSDSGTFTHLTILYPSIEGNLGGDIEGRRAGREGERETDVDSRTGHVA